ncbi:type II toxin-antitoxin system antitoxin SocA domain-containing protein [Solibacillus sp. CAU 1738]|uniref:Panacea domain-containing protein n=1 Tax=Solibacillus sp. CAU 1738 TaxID=3140363 RepID=UPI003261CD87
MDALRISSNIINEMRQRNLELDHIKLQKLLYFFAVKYFRRVGIIPFEQRIEKWKLGPVIREVYKEYKINGANKIIEPTTSLKLDGGRFVMEVIQPEMLTEEDAILLNETIEEYGHLNPFDLVEITHQENAWAAVEQDIINRVPNLYYDEDDFIEIVGAM